jgi:hypothetical protein
MQVVKHPCNVISPSLALDVNVIRCEIDGSYTEVNNAGYGDAGMVLARGDQLIQYSTSHFLAISHLEAELKAFKWRFRLLEICPYRKALCLWIPKYSWMLFQISNPHSIWIGGYMFNLFKFGYFLEQILGFLVCLWVGIMLVCPHNLAN